MDTSQKILSEITTFSKYARYYPEISRREIWEELVQRNIAMQVRKYPELKEYIKWVYKEFVMTKKVLPSMRMMQFAGRPIELSENRLYNCSYMSVNAVEVFPETMFLLLGGCGVGYSVQKHIVAQLPKIIGPTEKNRRFLVGDSIEGWAEAIKVTVNAYFFGKSNPVFDFRDIRQKGARLVTTGGKAPGPDPLRICIDKIRAVMNNAIGRSLQPIEVHDIMCHIADAVLSGGIRRAAMIALFSHDDLDMLSCKSGAWWELNPQRGRANNSVVLERGEISAEQFQSIWNRVQESGSGEPGFFWTHDLELGTNPCCVAGDQMIHTTEGLKRVDQLIDTPFKAVVGGSVHESAGFWLTGEKPVYKVKTARGYELRVTADHRILTPTDGFVELQDLEVGDMISLNAPPPMIVFDADQFKLGWVVGEIWGDGYLSETNGVKGAVQFWGETAADMSQRAWEIIKNLPIDYNQPRSAIGPKELIEKDSYLISFKALGEFARKYLEMGTKNIKDALMTESQSFVAGFLRGIFDADGTISGNTKTTAVQLQLAQSKYEDLVRVQRMLQMFGIVSSIRTMPHTGKSLLPDGRGGHAYFETKQPYRIDIGRDSVERFAEVIGFSDSHKAAKLQQLIESKVRKSYSTRYETQITSIELDGCEEVYDCTVEGAHAFSCNGVVVHNCEISLRNQGFCNLTEINAGDIDSQEELEARARAAAFLGTLQAGYTNFHYLRPEWKENAESEALLGVSMTGIASGAVMSLDLARAAQEVIKENQRVAAIIGINPAKRTTCLKPAGCLDPETVIRTNKGNLTLCQIFELNGFDIDKMELGFHGVREEICVFDKDNNLQPITKLFNNGVAETFDVELEDGTVVHCTPNHKFMTQSGWKRADELVEGDDILHYDCR